MRRCGGPGGPALVSRVPAGASLPRAEGSASIFDRDASDLPPPPGSELRLGSFSPQGLAPNRSRFISDLRVSVSLWLNNLQSFTTETRRHRE